MRRPAVLLALCLLAGCGAVTTDAQVVSTRPVTPSAQPTTSAPAGTTSPPTAKPGTPPSSGTAPATPGTAPATPTLAWQQCAQKVQCATLTVPKDYADPTKGTMELFVKRRKADRASARIGSLLVNPGGPGAPASKMVDDAVGYFTPTLLQRFDIVAWDPRGTGKSGLVNCVDSLDPYFGIDQSPDDAAEAKALVDAAADFRAKCEQRSGDILPYVSTEATARDMDTIRRALGEDKISYFGFSYGSELGAVWATLFPSTVRAAVLDGASDVNATTAEDLKQQTVGLERALDAALANCAADRSCPIYNGGKPGEVFDKVMADLDRQPLTVPGKDGAPSRQVTQGVAYSAAIAALYDKATWIVLTTAFANAAAGDGQLMLDMYDQYFAELGSHAFESLIAIRCIDQGGDDRTDYAALQKELTAIAPRIGPGAIGPVFCAGWPAKGPVEPKVSAKGAGPIVVVGTTGDPVTPIEASTNLAKSLEQGVLVTVQAEKHTGYQTSACIDNAVDTYLVKLTVPKEGTVCKATG